jgi:uncharacterized protein (TIGR02594 family)
MEMTTEPPWMMEARKLIGVREIRGQQHSPAIMAMIRDAGPQPARDGQPARRGWLGITVKDDETPWCGTFVAACLARSGFLAPAGAIGVRAMWWAGYGTPLPLAAPPPVGAIAVFNRTGGGHVGFIESANADGSLNILGGNQGDAVNVRRFGRERLVALRWPPGVPVGPVARVAARPAANTTGEA